MFKKIFKKMFKKKEKLINYEKCTPLILLNQKLNEYIYIPNEKENNEYIKLLNKFSLEKPRYCDYYSDSD